MKIRTQLFANAGAVLTVLLGVAAGTHAGVSSLIETAGWVNHTHQVMTDARLLAKYMVDMETGQRGFLLTGQEEFLDPYIAGQRGFEQTLHRASELVADNPDQVQRLQLVGRLEQGWIQNAGEAEINLRRSVDSGGASWEALVNLLRGLDGSGAVSTRRTGKQRMDEIRAILDDVVEEEARLLERRQDENQAAAEAAQNLTVWGSLLALLLALLLTVYLARKLHRELGAEPAEIRRIASKVAAGELLEVVRTTTGPGRDHMTVADHLNAVIRTFREAAKSADEVAQGNFETQIQLKGDTDTLGIALRRMTARLQRVTALNEEDRWVKEGQNEITESLRGEQSIGPLAKSFVARMCAYLEACVGAFYALDGEQYRLVGSYAFTHRKGTATSFVDGEGLVGQVALEQELLVVSHVPAGYVEVRSGLGMTTPSHIVLVPLVHEGRSVGVLELGLLREPPQPTLDLLARIAPAVAIAVNSCSVRTKAGALLQSSQVQTRELAVQQEKLQAANSNLAPPGADYTRMPLVIGFPCVPNNAST